ncbi:hypothetical protein JM47_00370 [Ureaplasma diversum]|uniref:Fatty acid-binding protein DegV n=1 Tax=Ureaplasma diversum TaxID=42094 RepID=A0A0C5RL18_9BACT|nr:DegV family protein [Ureaplasma diversum]AJQ45117.1 hypothetical protein JM47_00370 [Ureaplasma diversum]
MKKPFLILVDSSATNTIELAQMEDVKILPLSIIRSDDKVFEDDNKSINANDIFEMLDQKYHFSTSCTPIGVLHQEVEQGLQEYEKVVILTISGGYSSQFNNALSLKKEFGEEKVIVADTKSFGYALELLIKHLKEMFKKQPTNQEIEKYIDNFHDFTIAVFACENTAGLVASGRLPKIVSAMLKLTKITPIIKSEYKNKSGGVARNMKTAPEKMLSIIAHTWHNNLNPDEIESIAVLHAGLSDEQTEPLRQLAIRTFNLRPEQVVVRHSPSVFLVYVYKNAIGYQIVTKKSKV